jgi:quinohemoprotein ethanol dehydrogenase
MAYDPELKLLYIGTGNGGPWNRQYRSPAGGDNLYLSSIVAINPSDGKLVWYYQTTPGDSWDYTATQPMILADLEINGEKRKVIMQAPKNGFFYVVDRTNGKLISAKPYTYINWARNIDSITGRPVENDFSRYISQNTQIFPHPLGAHNWQPMSYNQQTKLVYFTVRDLSLVYGNDPNWKHNEPSGYGSGTGWNTATLVDPSKPIRMDSSAPKKASSERLVAWDPVYQREKWTMPLVGLWNGGVMTTSTGLVFEGTADGKFMARDAGTGNILWEFNIGSGIIGTPVSYEVDGKQYISIVAGWGGVAGLSRKFTEEVHPGTIYTFTVDGSSSIPVFSKANERKLIDLPFTTDKNELSAGSILYFEYCGACHGEVGGGGGALPDLSYSSKEVHGIFNDIVLRGEFLEKGMPNFGNRLSAKDVTNIQNYILATAKEKITKQKN